MSWQNSGWDGWGDDWGESRWHSKGASSSKPKRSKKEENKRKRELAGRANREERTGKLLAKIQDKDRQIGYLQAGPLVKLRQRPVAYL